ncbi:hypothetical protein MNR01_06630 [Lysobacter sp. S4-A87]|uniref:hypothetical protein n=1 Tax=Lysobacter sp. S4-A87 TaxID=2925843 RepID=UPI001F53A8A3|nr:hypothetical protein [Lysobacter sp. S4-A87]UNK50677.1 hypothetical protein MNR01_06630 [Lysobacter sp. S4-A87]
MAAFRHLITIVALAAAMAACSSSDKPPGQRGGDDSQALPAPSGKADGSVTGMPDKPGPGQVGPPPQVVEEVVLDEQGNPIAPTDEAGQPLPGTDTGATPSDGEAVNEPTAQDAMAVVRDYYAAINSRAYDRAYSLWSDGGRASGQSPQQFADGFRDTSGVSVEILAPGAVDAAAGSRFVEVPVALTATAADGSQRKFVGAYTLRRAVVDGATAEQRAWRIGSADLREVTP